MGNSEVGHLNLGAGRIVYQEIVRIDRGIKDGTFFANPAIVETIEAAKRSGGTLHLLGLTSPGDVHASLEHAYAVCETAKRRGLDRVYWHAFLDGRDTPPRSAAGYLREVDAQLKKIGVGSSRRPSGATTPWIATSAGSASRSPGICSRAARARWSTTWPPPSRPRYSGAQQRRRQGRDRRVRQAAAACAAPTARRWRPSRDGDACFFFNFRADRARELTRRLHAPEFPHFDRAPRPKLAAFVCMTQYDAKLACRSRSRRRAST